MKPENDRSKEDYEKILKIIEQESSAKKKERAMNILTNENHKNKKYTSKSFITIFTEALSQKQREVLRFTRVKQNKHTIILTAFLVFSTYLCWCIEQKYDMMRKKARKSQTYKERQVEKENEYIEKMLRKKQFEAVPIPDQIAEHNTYKYEQQNQTQGHDQFTIDTRQDLIEAIEEQTGIRGAGQAMYEKQLHREKQRKPI